jgi:hypothetical protein
MLWFWARCSTKAKPQPGRDYGHRHSAKPQNLDIFHGALPESAAALLEVSDSASRANAKSEAD